MKTLHLTNAYHETSGGIRTWYQSALEGANRRSHDFRLVVPAAKEFVEEIGKARIYGVPAPRTPVFDSRYRLLLPHTYALPFTGRVRRILLDEQPDLLEISEKYTLSWLAGVVRKGWVKGLRRPVLVGLSFERMDDNVVAFLLRRQSSDGRSSGGGRVTASHTASRASDRSGARAVRLARLYMRRLYFPLFDYHIAVSDYTAAELFEAVGPRANGRVFVHLAGIESRRFRPDLRSENLRERILQDCGGTSSSSLLVYAGRLSPEKNVGLVLDMMAILSGDAVKDYRLLIVGGGPLTEWMATHGRLRAPGRIRIVGHMRDRDELARLLASCDVFLHPNPREPFGFGPLEAMASGCPVVLPNSGGVLSYATQANTWLVPCEAASFAEAVRSAVLDREQRSAKTAAARRTAERFDTMERTERLFRLYEVLSERSRQDPDGSQGPGL